MISNNVKIWGDGHSVIDAATKKVLNLPTTPILIGDHVWIGERVTLCKGAQIPNNCIVGLASVVTKAFSEENCVIAGAPAKVVKTGVTWHGADPLRYKAEIEPTLCPSARDEEQ
jgi:acetyltransferase-like isoleucine patch superfamily enzyme